jgi:integrase
MRGNITRRGKASWRIKFDLPPGPDGKRRIQFVTVRGAKKDAQAKLAEMLAAVGKGIFVEPSHITVGEWVSGRIDEWEASGDISARSAEGYRRKFINYIKPHLGHKLLQALTPRVLEGWHFELRTSGRKRAGGVGPLTVRSAHRILGKALAEAVRYDLIQRNVASPAAGGQRTPRVMKREVEIISEETIVPMLAKLRASHEAWGERGRPVRVGRTLYPKIITLLFTGLRRGELLALRWCDLDFVQKRLRVCQALEQTTQYGLRVKSVKTEAGRREISLPDIVIEALEEHRRAQLEVRLKLGLGRIAPDDFVFVALDGGPQRPDNFSGDWKEIRAALGVPHIGLHALRHTHASMLIAGGLDIVQVSKRLGHASPAITLAVYSHLFRKDDSAVSAAINATLAKLGK